MAGKGFEQDNLALRLRTGKGLSEAEQDKLASLLGKGCRARTKDRLRSVLRFPTGAQVYGIYERVMLGKGADGQGVFYCAGQDYTAEIATVRNCLLGR